MVPVAVVLRLKVRLEPLFSFGWLTFGRERAKPSSYLNHGVITRRAGTEMEPGVRVRQHHMLLLHLFGCDPCHPFVAWDTFSACRREVFSSGNNGAEEQRNECEEMACVGMDLKTYKWEMCCFAMGVFIIRNDADEQVL